MSAEAFVVSAGATPASVAVSRLPLWNDPMVIAADGGYLAACALGYRITALVGDLDSIRPDDLDGIDRSVTDVIAFATEKDATDLELAIDEAIARGATRVCVVDAMQGRTDHFIASMMLLGAKKYSRIAMSACIGSTRLWATSPQQPCVVEAEIGATISIVALGDALGVSTVGLRYRLDDESLRAGTSRGVSNVCVASPFHVTVAKGALLVIDEGIIT